MADLSGGDNSAETQVKVEKVVIPLPEEDRICPVCGTQMVLIGEEYVRRELEFIPATCKVIEYYSQSYGCPSCKEGLGDTEKRKDSAIRKSL